jgi:hypothetical protein
MSRRQIQRNALALALSAGLFGFAVAGPADAAAKNRRQQAEWRQEHEQKKEQQREAKQRRASQREAAQQAQQAQREQRQANQQAARDQARSQRQAEWRQQREQQEAVQQQQRAVQQRQRTVQREQQQVLESQRRVQRRQAVQTDSRQAEFRAQQQRRIESQDRVARLSTDRQRQLITVQQQRRTGYASRLAAQQRLLAQQASVLRQQRRFAQYRYQQQYLDNLRRQQLALQNARYDYYSDPYFYTAPSYRYSYGGRYYETNRYGVDLLREALNLGYREGYLSAQADLQDHWGYNYRDAFAYRDANYGYDGLYIDQSQYNYYFREGFRRGYDDGYYRRSQYGYRRAGQLELIANLIDTILRLHYLN